MPWRWVLGCAGVLALSGTAAAQPLYRDASANLPLAVTGIRSMDAEAFDADGDGDQDIVVAHEFGPNLLLVNDGKARFALAPTAQFPLTYNDHEDIAAADFDRDGDIDLVFACEDDRAKLLFLNDGRGTFTNESARLPQTGVSNGVAAGDADGDGDADLVFANAGADFLWLNDGRAGFTDASDRLPQVSPADPARPDQTDVSQDVKLADLDGDGDLDAVFGNEDGNRILLNDGRGTFTQAPLPLRAAPEETRKAALADIDGDGDRDLLFANVRFFMAREPRIADRQDRLLVNDGRGGFGDATASLPADDENTAHAAFTDLDGDGDADIVATSVESIQGAGTGRLKARLNDGAGHFADATDAVFPATAIGNGFDTAAADFDGDGRADLYVANRVGADLLLLRGEP